MTDSEKPTATPPGNTPGEGSSTASTKGPTARGPQTGDTPPANTPPQQQDALDVMAALCREYGLDELAPGLLHSSSLFQSPTSSASSAPIRGDGTEPQETALSIIQKFLFDRDRATQNSDQNQTALDGYIPDPASVLANSTLSPALHRADQQKGSDMNQSSEAQSTPSFDSASAQWRVTTTRPDGGETGLGGAVINDDMFRTAMPHLHGTDSRDATTPDWTIDLAQSLPLAAGRTDAQTAISAKLIAPDTPGLIDGWRLCVGPKAGAQSELATTLPQNAPSHLRALLFDTTVTDQAQDGYSDMAAYGGGPYALHLEQSIGDIPGDSTPNLALIRLVFADRPAIPAQMEYVGSLPSPILRGAIPISATLVIPFWMQITPPSEGDKGAGLVILVQYDQETSFNVTAQLLTSSKSCTPTAILSCSGQSDNSACRAASMIANASGRLETTLTGLASAPSQPELAGYGFCLDAATDSDSASSSASPAKSSTAGSAKSSQSNQSSAGKSGKSGTPDTDSTPPSSKGGS